MSEEMIHWMGVFAGLCTTIAFIPQVILVYKTQRTHDISLGMFSIFTFGLILWLFYGIFLNATPIIIANAVTILLAGYILVKKIQLG